MSGLPPEQREYTITLAYHLREFLIFALDRWTEQGLNRGEAVSIRAALLRDEGHEPLFDCLKAEIQRLKAEMYDLKAGIRLVQDSCLAGQSAAEADAARLDWLEGELAREQKAHAEQSPCVYSLFRSNMPITREAIDAAMERSR